MIASFSLLVASAAAHAEPPQRVKIRVASHLPQATQVSERFHATCDKIDYTLVVDRKLGSVTLLSAGAADVSLGATPLGAAMLDRQFFGQVGFNCPIGFINIFVGGVAVKNATPVGVRYIAIVKRSGEISNVGPLDLAFDDIE
jgi:hypothetical protein